MQSKRLVCSLTEAKQHPQAGVTAGERAPAQPWGTSLSPSPPRHPRQHGASHTESTAVLRVTREREETPAL